MTKNDREDFLKLFSGICEVYGKEITTQLTDIYFNSFEKFSIERVKEAFNRHTLSSKFFPKPSELIDLLEGNKEEKAIEAWTVLRDTIRHHGGDRSVLFTDPKISWIVESYGGWIRVCDMETIDLDFMRLGFIKAYINARDDLPQRKFIGRFEWDNDKNGYLTAPYTPLIIGNMEEIKMIKND